MRRTILILPAMAILAGFPLHATADIAPRVEAKTGTMSSMAVAPNIMLGSAGDFAVLGGSTVTNTGPSVISGGHVGVSSGSSITGFPEGMITPPYTTHAGDGLAISALGDLTSAFNAAADLPHTRDLTGQDLGGLTLLPGVYFFSSSAQLTGDLSLNNMGNPNAQFVFQIGSTLTSAIDSSVMMSDGSSMGGCNVFWQVGSSATLDTNTTFTGHILAATSITLNTGASIFDGSALARDGAVTLDTNNVTNCLPVPEPASSTLALIGGVMLIFRRSRRGSALDRGA